MRKEIIKYIKETYDIDTERPWMETPENEVVRHPDNKKWFGIFMRVERNKVGMQGTELVDIMNVKADPYLIDVLRGTPGFYPGYHMNHLHWLTIVLDGTVDAEQIESLIDSSYDMTAKKIVKRGRYNEVASEDKTISDVTDKVTSHIRRIKKKS